MQISKAVQSCIDDLSLARNTARAYKNGIKCFLIYLSERGVKQTDETEHIVVDDFIYFPAWLDKRYSKGTCGLYISSMKAFFDFLIISNLIAEPTHLDMLRYKMAVIRSHRRHEDKLPRFPQKDDVSRMQEAVRIMNEISPRKERDIALVEFLASSGCRISEVIALNVQDIDIENKTSIVVGKGSKERRVFFNQLTADALVTYWKERKSAMATDPIFARHDRGAGHKRLKRMTTTTARNIITDIAKVAGIDTSKMSPHYFRHAFAIRVLQETGNLALAQDLLGHSDPKSTRVYAKIRPDELQKAHQAIFENN